MYVSIIHLQIKSKAVPRPNHANMECLYLMSTETNTPRNRRYFYFRIEILFDIDQICSFFVYAVQRHVISVGCRRTERIRPSLFNINFRSFQLNIVVPHHFSRCSSSMSKDALTLWFFEFLMGGDVKKIDLFFFLVLMTAFTDTYSWFCCSFLRIFLSYWTKMTMHVYGSRTTCQAYAFIWF